MPFPLPAQVYYCGACFIYIGPTGKRVPYETPELIIWTECARCMEHRLEQEAMEEERRSEEEEWATPRICAAAGCEELFRPRTRWQRFHSSECRWRAHRQRGVVAS